MVSAPTSISPSSYSFAQGGVMPQPAATAAAQGGTPQPQQPSFDLSQLLDGQGSGASSTLSSLGQTQPGQSLDSLSLMSPSGQPQSGPANEQQVGGNLDPQAGATALSDPNYWMAYLNQTQGQSTEAPLSPTQSSAAVGQQQQQPSQTVLSQAGLPGPTMGLPDTAGTLAPKLGLSTSEGSAAAPSSEQSNYAYQVPSQSSYTQSSSPDYSTDPNYLTNASQGPGADDYQEKGGFPANVADQNYATTTNTGATTPAPAA